MGRGTMMRAVTLALMAGTALTAAPAWAAADISPYIEVQQILDANLSGDGDVLTYTSISAGVDGSISTQRSEATVSYRYDRRIPWGGDYGSDDVHSGLARARIGLIPGKLNLEAGAIATRARQDIRGPAPVGFGVRDDNISQVYGLYAGPSFATTLGEFNVQTAYQFGYVKVDQDNGFTLPTGQPVLDAYDDATSHLFTGSIGTSPGNSLTPFGWTVSVGYQREDASQLDQRYDGKFARLDLVQPISPTLAVTAGVGYEDIESSERFPLVVNGAPVLTSGGRYVTDPNSPRQLSYDEAGLIYDGGVIWRPNTRTTAQIRIGHRYGGTMVVGSLDYRMSSRAGLQIQIFDGIESFGRSLTRGVAGLPTNFQVDRNPLAPDFSGCVFGPNPGSGGCLDATFQSIATSNYRNRGVVGLFSVRDGAWNYGVGAGYAQRKYLAPASGAFFSVAGVKDESVFVQANASRRLTANSGVDLDLYGSWYSSGILDAADVYGSGAIGSYYHNFGNRLTGRAAVGVYAYDQEGFQTDVNGQLLLGMRYQF